MIINFEFRKICWLDSKVLTLGKSCVTLNIDLKSFG